MMSFKKLLQPLETQYVGNYTIVTFPGVLDRTNFAPKATFISNAMTAVNISPTELSRFYFVASKVAPTFYAAAKGNCIANIMDSSGDIVTTDIPLSSSYSISNTYPDGATLAIDQTATGTQWMTYLTASLAKCNSLFPTAAVSDIETAIDNFVDSSNSTLVTHFGL